MKKIITSLAVVSSLMLASCDGGSKPAEKATQAVDEGWVNLFDGKSLDGWAQVNGAVDYAAVDGELVATSVLNSPNSFLATTSEYSDFILEYEAKIDSPLNSGVQIRSFLDDNREGSVSGFQIEIDTSSRGWSGALYEEGIRGFLQPHTEYEPARKAFKNDDWNHYRVEAIGKRFRTWINGVPAGNLIDDHRSTGFIGLQVHGIDSHPERKGMKSRWRNVRIKTENLALTDTEYPERNNIPNTLTEVEKAAGWKMIWDGKTTNGWTSAKGEAFPSQGWEIKDGTLSVLPSDGSEGGHGGDIITAEEYSDFELSVDFKVTEGANSGIKYFVDPTLLKGKGSAIGLEFQVLDAAHPDALLGVAGNRTMGSLYDLITAKSYSEPDRAVRVNKLGLWNNARIVVRGSHVQHWLNHVKVVEYNRHSQIFKALVAYSKYKDWNNFGGWDKGPILLQDHGDRVSYRSIKIRTLEP